VPTSSGLAIAVSIKTIDTAQSASSKQAALRLFSRAMIRLYLQDRGNPNNGERIGVL
jgi:hypothetical protein